MKEERNSKSKVLLIGASGLIGSELLQLALQDDSIAEVVVLVRRKLDFAHPKLIQHLVDFNHIDQAASFFDGFETVFCAIGTTRKKTPDLTDYRKIDFGIPTDLMKIASEKEVPNFMLVSSIGASSASSNFYLKIKGEVEDFFQSIPFQKRGIFQPSLLLGQRKENRFGERFAKAVVPIFNFLTPKKYRAIEARVVARAMLNSAKFQTKNTEIYTYAEMQQMLRH